MPVTVAVLPSKKAALERAAGFLEHHLIEIRQQAIRSDAQDYAEGERLVLDATETAYAAGMLREMAAHEPDEPDRQFV